MSLNKQMEDDISLVGRYIAGDAGAFEELVMRYQKQIYAFVYRMTNEVEEAKDLTQKTFLKALKGIKGFRKKSSFKTWLYQIAVNTSLDHIKRDRHKEIEIDGSEVCHQEGILSSIIENEKKDHIKRGIAMLPERQRLAIILRVYEGLGCIETAEVMKCSEGAVKAHYHNGVKRLRELLKEKGCEVGS